MEQNKSNALVNQLREMWRKGEWKDFHRVYNLSKWMLPKEEVEKIDAALIAKGFKKASQKPPGEQLTVEDILKAFPGSKIVDE